MAAALLHNRMTGNGVYVDVSQVECAAWTLSDWLLAYHRDGVIGERRGNAHPDAALHGLFRCAGEDRWIAVAAWDDDELHRLHALTGEDVEAWTVTRDPQAVASELQDAGLEAVPVQDFADLNNDPQLAHRGHFVRLEHPELGDGEYEHNGFRVDELAAGYDRSGPTLGQDNDWVLGDLLHLSTAEQERLRADGAFA
jgi:crotonobetainyl-CoA:carnitine CoA-transferase CaiB-like acyl-CoA transferase